MDTDVLTQQHIQQLIQRFDQAAAGLRERLALVARLQPVKASTIALEAAGLSRSSDIHWHIWAAAAEGVAEDDYGIDLGEYMDGRGDSYERFFARYS